MIAAYNAGIGNVDYDLEHSDGDGIPNIPSVQNYVEHVSTYMTELQEAAMPE